MRLKRFLAFAVAFVMVMTMMPAMSLTAFAEDSVTSITSLEELKTFRDNVNSGSSYGGLTVELKSDITLSGDWTPIGNGTRDSKTYTGNAFKGTFNGNGHTITGLTVISADCAGLFGVLDGATVSNVKFADVNINVTTKNAGALAGLAVGNSKISGVETAGSITAADGAGGVLGRMTVEGEISGCTNNATVTATSTGAGGIVGKAYYTEKDKELTISGCVNNGAVTGGYAAGGITALSAANVSGCTNTAVITAGTEAGGIVGEQLQYGEVSGNTNTAEIKNNGGGTSYGGIIGWVRYPYMTGTDYLNNEVITVSDNVNSGTVSASGASLGAGGIVGTIYNQAVVKGNVNTAESITSGVFAAGIVGGLQHAENNLAIENATITVSDNATNTAIENITASNGAGCVALVAYNNDATTFVVEDNAESFVALVNSVACADAAAMVTAIANATGDVTVEIYGKVETTGFDIDKSGITKLSFVGKDTDAEICVDGIGYINVRNTSYPIEFTDLTLSKINGAEGIDGFMNTYFTTYNGGNVTYTNCTFPNGVTAIGSVAGTTCTFNNCTFNNTTSGKYSLWVYGNSTNVVVNGGEFNGVRGIKLYSEGSNDFSALTVTGATFSNTITEKHAVVLTKGESVTLTNNTYNNTTGTVQVDDGYASSIEGKTVTIDGVKYTVDSENKTLVAAGLEGEGTEESPYLIKTADDLKLFRDSVNSDDTTYNAKGVWVALANNIDLADIDWSVNIGDDCNYTFDGIFDGKNYTISNLTSTETAAKSDGYICTGLFGAIYGDAVVKNLTINNASISTGDFTGNNVGVVVGFAYESTGSVENVKVTGDIKVDAAGASGVGAIVGYAYGGSIVVKNCTVSGSDDSYIKGAAYAGGVVGYAGGKTTVTNCSVDNVDISAKCCVGGVAGIILDGGKAETNTVKSAELSATHENWQNSVAVTVGTITGAVTVSGTTYENVTGADSIVGSVWVQSPTEPVGKAEAVVGHTYFATWEKALEAATTEDVVTLLVPIVIESGEEVAIDLAGKTIEHSAACTAHYAMITNNGTLTINDSVGSGVIRFTDTGDGDSTFGWGSYTIDNYGTLIVNGGTVENASVQNKSTSVSHMYCAVQQANGSTTVNGGTIKNDTYRSARVNRGTFTVNDGTFTGQLWVQPYADDANLTINGGSFAPTGVDGSSVFVENSTYDVDFEVTDGYFATKIGCSDADDLPGAITGGTFTAAAKENTNAALIAEGFEFVENTDGTYGVQKYVWDGVTISNLAELKAFRDKVNSGTTYDGETVTLTADIDLNNEAWTPIGNGTNKFLGTFDGGNNTISNLKVDVDTDNAGLFGFASVIKNVKIVNADVSGVVCVGALAGELESSVGTVDSCHVSGTITITGENSVGGLVGKGYAHIYNSSVDDTSAATSFVKGEAGTTEEGDNVGGIIGHLGEGSGLGVSGSTVKNITVKGTRKVGGIVGTTQRCNFVDNNTVDTVTIECTATEEYAADNESTTTIGGLVGNYFGTGTGGTLKGNIVTNVTLVAGYAKSAGALVGGNRTTPGEAFDGVTAESNTTTAVTGASNNYFMPVYVAQVGDNKYEDLQSAIDAAEDKATVKLLANIDIADIETTTLDGSYNTYFRVTGKSITVDMNGKTISGEYELSDMLVGVFSTEQNGHLTLTGNGIVDVTATAKVYALLVNYDATSTLTVENGRYEADSVSNALVYTDKGTVEGLYGFTVSGVTINGGTFTLENIDDVNGPWIFNVGGAADSYVTVNGGTFNFDIAHQKWATEVIVNKECYVNDNGDGTWTVTEGAAACLNDTVFSGGYAFRVDYGYPTLAAAMAAAEEDDVITLLADATDIGAISLNKAVTIDGANHTISGKSKFNVSDGVTFKNINFKDITPGENWSAIVAGGLTGDLTVDNCTFTNVEYDDIQIVGKTGANVVITNSTFDGSGKRSIHIEPSKTDNVVMDITIAGNKFYKTSANATSIGVYYPDSTSNLTIEKNYVEDPTTIVVALNVDGVPTNCNEKALPLYDEALENEINYIVKVNGGLWSNNFHTSLADAFADARGVVTLLDDITLTETITNERTKHLDLNGHTITGTDNNTSGNFYLFDNRKTLVVKDSVGGGEITLEATNDREWSASSVVIANNPGGTLTVNGGTIEHLGGTSMAYGIDNLTNGTGTYAKTVINGGTVKSTYRAIRQFLNGTEADNILEINGGTIEGDNKSVWMQDPSTNANSGTLAVSEEATLNGDVYLYVTAGSTEYPVAVSIAAAALSEGSEVLTANFPEGYELELNEGVYGVVEIDYVEWVQDELLAGRSVTLDRDIVVDGSYIRSIPHAVNNNGEYPNYGIFTVVGDYDVTVDLNGHEITYNGHADFDWNGNTYSSCTVAHGLFFSNGGADLTITDSVGTAEVMVYGMASGAYVATPDTTLTIKGGTWKNEGCATCGGTNIFLYPLQGGELYIEDGYFEQELDANGDSYLIVEHGGSVKNDVIDYSKTKVEISGGTFVGMNPEEIKKFDQSSWGTPDMTQTTDGCAEGYEAVENTNGTYGIEELDAVAKVGDVEYYSLQDAFDEVSEDNATVTLLTDASENVTANAVGGAVTVTTNDFAYTGTVTLEPGAWVVADEEITVAASDEEYPVVKGANSDKTMFGYAAMETGVDMVQGAQVRIGNGVDSDGKINNSGSVMSGSGLRFVTTLDFNDTMVNYADVPEENDTDYKYYKVGVNIRAEDSDEVVSISAYHWQTESIFTTALTNLAVSNYVREFTANSYVEIDGIRYESNESVTRSIYKVAAGLLITGDAEVDSDGNSTYDPTAENLIKVLNAYVNQTGIRLVLVEGENHYDLVAHDGTTTSTKGGDYGYDSYFEVSETEFDNINNTYTVTLTAKNNAKIYNHTVSAGNAFWYDYVRINNNNSKVKTKVEMTEIEKDKVYKLTFKAEGLVKPLDNSGTFEGEYEGDNEESL